jgi:hypothetical protein
MPKTPLPDVIILTLFPLSFGWESSETYLGVSGHQVAVATNLQNAFGALRMVIYCTAQNYTHCHNLQFDLIAESFSS